MQRRIFSTTLLSLLLLHPGAALGQEPAQETTPRGEQVNEIEWDLSQYDLENAEEILETCAGCHGTLGEGGKNGTYPRLAGMRAKYIAKQLRAFKSKERVNIPMFPYATERELPEDDLRDISIYYWRIKLLRKMPQQDEPMDAWERLMIAKTVFNVPRIDGDIEKGGALYEENCRTCHGRNGWGRAHVPQLAGQHTNYLRRQIGVFLAGERWQEEKMDAALRSLTAEDVENILAFLASADD